MARLPTVTMAESGADLTVARGCPFLLSEGGGWRLDLPTRAHRCAAFAPPAQLAPEKQSRLCLTPEHLGCATYLASLAARTERLGEPSSERATRWGLARTTTVIEDPGGMRGRVLGLVLDRRRWPAIPAVLLITTLFTLALSGFRAGGSSSAAATGGPTPTTAAATIAPTAGPTTAPVETSAPQATVTAPPATAAPTPKPTKTPKPPAPLRTYRVQSGDTLSGIASQFGTTPGAIARLNGISVGSTLRIGQVLKIPR